MADFFTVIDENTNKENRLYFEDLGDAIALSDGDNDILVSKQQIFELGALFLTLAGPNVDRDSAIELLDGFGMLQSGQQLAVSYVKAMTEE